jgi:hypothetical protein
VTLVITALAALAVTVVRFARPQVAARWRLGLLALILWGASLMWVADLISVTAAGDAFISLADRSGTLNDTVLGASVLALAIFVWLIVRTVTRKAAPATARTAA